MIEQAGRRGGSDGVRNTITQHAQTARPSTEVRPHIYT